MKIIYSALFLFMSTCIFAQLHVPSNLSSRAEVVLTDEEEEEEVKEDPFKGLSFGLNIGAYFASAKTGNFYNGNSVAVLEDSGNGVQYYNIADRFAILTPNEINAITSYYNATGVEIPYDSSPLNMRYMPAFYVGLQIKYNFTRYESLVFNLNGTRLKAASEYTIRLVGTPQQINAQQDIRLMPIEGNEQRLNINLGYRQGWEVNDITNFYIQPGGSFLATKMMSNKIYIADRNYELFIGAQNPNQVVNYVPRADGSFGYYISTGFEFFFKDAYSFDISFGFSREKVILLNYEEKVWNKWLQVSFTL